MYTGVATEAYLFFLQARHMALSLIQVDTNCHGTWAWVGSFITGKQSKKTSSTGKPIRTQFKIYFPPATQLHTRAIYHHSSYLLELDSHVRVQYHIYGTLG